MDGDIQLGRWKGGASVAISGSIGTRELFALRSDVWRGIAARFGICFALSTMTCLLSFHLRCLRVSRRLGGNETGYGSQPLAASCCSCSREVP